MCIRDRDSGARVTIKSDPDKTTIWLNGKKICEDLTLATTAEGKPSVSWAAGSTTVTSIKVWKPRTENDEPVYNEKTDILKKQVDKVTVAQNSVHAFDVAIPEDETYYATFTAKGNGQMNFVYRENGESGLLVLNSTQYYIPAVSDAWPNVDGGTGTTKEDVYKRQGSDCRKPYYGAYGGWHTSDLDQRPEGAGFCFHTGFRLRIIFHKLPRRLCVSRLQRAGLRHPDLAKKRCRSPGVSAEQGYAAEHTGCSISGG